MNPVLKHCHRNKPLAPWAALAALLMCAMPPLAAAPNLSGVWYSQWEETSAETKTTSQNHMLDYFHSDNTYRSTSIEIHADKYYYEENEGTWSREGNKLSITILKVNGKAATPWTIPSTIQFQGPDKIIFRLLDPNDVPDPQPITLQRTTKDKKLPIPTDKKRAEHAATF